MDSKHRLITLITLLVGIFSVSISPVVGYASRTGHAYRNHPVRIVHQQNRRTRNHKRSGHHSVNYYVSGAKQMKFQPQYNTDACEIASIKNILSIHHRATHVSMYKMLHRIKWKQGGNWNREYTANPYHFGTSASISPWLEAQILRRYGVHAHVHNFANKKTLIRDLRRGYQFVVEAGHDCNRYRIHEPHRPTDHILAIIGIKRNRHGRFVQFADSEHHSKKRGVRWCSFHKFWISYNRPRITGDRLVIVTK